MREVAKRSFDGGREKCLTVLSPSFAIAQQPPRQRDLGGYHLYTHVLVDAPTRGYGIFAENMLETAQGVAEEKLKEVS